MKFKDLFLCTHYSKGTKMLLSACLLFIFISFRSWKVKFLIEQNKFVVNKGN